MEKHFQTFIMTVFTAIALWVGNSVSNLNEKVATIIERTASHEKRISNLEHR